MMEIAVQDETYGQQIKRYFSKEVPLPVVKDHADLLEIIFDILIGTKETRFGAIPIPEHLIVIRKVIKEAIIKSLPIPLLVPFGGIKADKTGDIDIAEFAAIKRLTLLNECISKFHSPGLHIHVRIEDVNAIFLYGEEYRPQIANYSTNLSKLVSFMGEDIKLFPVRERNLLSELEYVEYSNKVKEPMLEYIKDTEIIPSRLGNTQSFKKLEEIGWKGVIPFEQRDFYVQRYEKLYPGKKRKDYLEMVATYLAGSKARHDLKATAAPDIGVEGFIQLNYTQPVPGAPTTMFNNAIYYRTLPLSEARTHMPAWRSKGYLKIDSNGRIKSKITTFNDSDVINQLIKAKTILKSHSSTVEIRSDYLIS